MARLSRLYVSGLPQVAIQEVGRGERLAQDDSDFERLTRIVLAAARAQRFALHAFVVLPDAIRLVGSADDEAALPRTMQAISRSYVPGYNAKLGRSGPLWARRFRSTVIEPQEWVLTTMLEIERAPQLLGLVEDPSHYVWSSYRHHIGLTGELPLSDHDAYWLLGNTPFERQRVYRAQAAETLAPARREALWTAVNGGWALGSETFLARLQTAGGRRASPRRRGRPPRDPTA